MRKITLIIMFFFLSLTLNAQQFNLEFGKVLSSFEYKNSEGEGLDNLRGTTNNHIEIGFRMPIRKTQAYFTSGVSYNKYGATGSDNAVGNYYEWNVNYVGVNIGVGYEFFKSSSFLNLQNVNTDQGFTFFVQLSGASDFLVQGTQTINDDVYDLIGVEQFDKPFIFAYGGIGVAYYATKTFSVYAKYLGGMSFPVFKTEGDNEELYYITHTICLGVSISLPAKR